MPTRSVALKVLWFRPPFSCNPSSTRSSQAVRLRIRSAQTSADAEILALGFSIPEALAEVTHDIRGPVTQAIIEAIQQGIGASRTVAA
jgi:hypothetical protein